ncbi:COX5A-domain-containing protein [Mycena venus]|uniref:Cytochrome c oxidase subunit 6, mitochondrial n=1 Tax=Mycena venus TaxID=2733690 RepID=A0A8H7D319_9AGAR|nr:COX5A-domain-containing protein [Mycena venus]
MNIRLRIGCEDRFNLSHKIPFLPNELLAQSPHRTLPFAIMRSQILSSVLRASVRPTVARRVVPNVLRSRAYSEHAQETFESFTTRYVEFFNQAEDIFEVQRGLNNCFAHDLVPAPTVIEAAVRAARRVDDFATAVRIFNGVKVKVENKKQYQDYLDELKGVREELGITLEEELYPEWEK